jgi:hypothetical protein
MTRPSTPLSSNAVAKVPSYERSVYEAFTQIYTTVLKLKNNRSKYIDSKQIYAIYDRFLDTLLELKLTRKDEELKGITVAESITDSLIDDVWQLLSLCFVTCGLTKFAPATYASLSAVHKLLDHLKECEVYTQGDLAPISSRLAQIKKIIDNNELEDEETEEFDDELIAKEYSEFSSQLKSHKHEENLLLRTKLSKCEKLYNQLQKDFENIPEDLQANYNLLVTMRKTLINYITNNVTVEPSVIEQFKSQIKSITSTRGPDGKFHSACDETNNFNAVMDGLVDDSTNLVRDLSMQGNNLSALMDLKLSVTDNEENRKTSAFIKQLDELYHQLIELRSTLENLFVTRRWTMRETDLYNYQKLLKGIDEKRLKINNDITTAGIGKSSSNLAGIGLNNNSSSSLATASGTTTPTPGLKSAPSSTASLYLKKQQILILYLLRRCYSLIYKLLESSEPVSESLAPIHNQLSTVRRCLLELKRVDGISNLRELFPFQFKLGSLDNLRVDGKFIINGHIPEGQGTLNALLAECFDIIQELKIELEEKEEADDSTVDENNGQQTVTQTNDDTEVDVKRSRFHEFNAADYDQDSESAFDDDDDDYESSEDEIEGNDYY